MKWDWLMLGARGWNGSAPTRTGADRCPPTTRTVDLELLRLYYGTVAARLNCRRCGARLRRPVLVTPASGYATLGAIAVTTRCRGWWRHPHRATVTGQAAGHLQLRELRPA